MANRVPETTTPEEAERLMREGKITNYAIVNGVAQTKGPLGTEDAGASNFPAANKDAGAAPSTNDERKSTAPKANPKY